MPSKYNYMHSATMWASAYVAGHDSHTLRRALAVVTQLPDAYSTGYSQARQARLRLEAELAKPERQADLAA